MSKKILVLPGDGIGPEIISEAVGVLEAIKEKLNLEFELDEALLGGAAIDATGVPFPDETLAKAQASDAILLKTKKAELSSAFLYKCCTFTVTLNHFF